MELEVLVEPAAGREFAARPGVPFDLTAEAPTAAEAVGAIQRPADGRVAGGARLVHVPVGTPPPPLQTGGRMTVGPPPGTDPWRAIAGVWKDDPTLDDFRGEVEQYRQVADADPDR